MPVSHVGYPGAALQLVGHAVQAGQPGGDEAGRVLGPEEPLASEVDIVVVPVPSQPRAAARRLGDLQCVPDRAVRDLEQAGRERRAAFVGERDGVLGGQRVAARLDVVADESARDLGVQQFPGVGFAGLGPGGRPSCGLRPVAGPVRIVA
jgi:hypothetical protein